MLYVCYGAKKSGSTLTYSLTRALLEKAGHPHIPLSPEDRRDYRRSGDASNTVRDWSDKVVAAALQKIPAHHIVSFRTHTGPSKAIAEAVRSGSAKVQISVRDPRDLALSMWDVLKRHRSMGRERPGRSLDSLPDILNHVERNVRSTLAWAQLGTPLVLNYEQTAFDPEASLAAICQDLGLTLAPDAFRQIFDEVTSTRNAQQNRNVARPQRHADEMSQEDQEKFLSRFRDYYVRFLPHVEGIPEATSPTEDVGPGQESKATRIAAREARTAARVAAQEARIAARAAIQEARIAARTAAQEARIAERVADKEERIAAKKASRDLARSDARKERRQEKAASSSRRFAKVEAKRLRTERKKAEGARAAKLAARLERKERKKAADAAAAKLVARIERKERKKTGGDAASKLATRIQRLEEQARASRAAALKAAQESLDKGKTGGELSARPEATRAA